MEGHTKADWLGLHQAAVQTEDAGKDYRTLHARWGSCSPVSVDTIPLVHGRQVPPAKWLQGATSTKPAAV
jgi:hypothetical protein